MVGRHAVWILGSASTLCAYSRLWRNLVDDAKQVNSFIDATRVEWMNDLINTSKHKPVYQQRDIDKRATKFLEEHPRIPASLQKSGWESEEPSMVRSFITLILLFSNVWRGVLCNSSVTCICLQIFLQFCKSDLRTTLS